MLMSSNSNSLLRNEMYWRSHPSEILEKLNTTTSGLDQSEVLKRQKQYGFNTIHNKNVSFLSILLRQFTGNPLIIILAIATFISFILGQSSSYYIFGIILASVFLGLWNEYSAEKTVENLLKKISPTALTERAGEKLEIPISHLTI